MPAKRERGFTLNIKSYSTKRSRAINERLTLSRRPVRRKSVWEFPAKSEELHVTDPQLVSVTDSTAKSRYERRKDADVGEWAAVRDELVRVYHYMEQPLLYMCSLCSKEVSDPVRCLDCHNSFVCCSECEVNYHHHLLHKPEIWNVRTCCFHKR